MERPAVGGEGFEMGVGGVREAGWAGRAKRRVRVRVRRDGERRRGWVGVMARESNLCFSQERCRERESVCVCGYRDLTETTTVNHACHAIGERYASRDFYRLSRASERSDVGSARNAIACSIGRVRATVSRPRRSAGRGCCEDGNGAIG